LRLFLRNPHLKSIRSCPAWILSHISRDLLDPNADSVIFRLLCFYLDTLQFGLDSHSLVSR
jgi:hypothetical protein